MIVGISHITINSNDLAQDIKTWQGKGYELAFTDKNIPNPEAKKPFLQNYQSKHSIALLKKAGANNIELIEHHKRSLGKNDLYEFEPFTINASEYDKSVNFWQNGLGFTFENGTLTKTTPMPQMSAKFKITKAVNTKCLLDYDGVTCVALYSTNLDDDIAELAKFGSEISDKIVLQVNGRALEIRMVQGPSGEMVELVKFS